MCGQQQAETTKQQHKSSAVGQASWDDVTDAVCGTTLPSLPASLLLPLPASLLLPLPLSLLLLTLPLLLPLLLLLLMLQRNCIRFLSAVRFGYSRSEGCNADLFKSNLKRCLECRASSWRRCERSMLPAIVIYLYYLAHLQQTNIQKCKACFPNWRHRSARLAIHSTAVSALLSALSLCNNNVSNIIK